MWRKAVIFVPLFLFCILAEQCLADDKAQVIAVDAELSRIEGPVKLLHTKIDERLDKLCPVKSDWQCLKKHSKEFTAKFDSAYEENIDASNKCFVLTQKIQSMKISPPVKSRLIEIVNTRSLKYSSAQNAYSYAQEGFEQLQTMNTNGFKANMAHFTTYSRELKGYYLDSQKALVTLKASMGIPEQK